MGSPGSQSSAYSLLLYGVVLPHTQHPGDTTESCRRSSYSTLRCSDLPESFTSVRQLYPTLLPSPSCVHPTIIDMTSPVIPSPHVTPWDEAGSIGNTGCVYIHLSGAMQSILIATRGAPTSHGMHVRGTLSGTMVVALQDSNACTPPSSVFTHGNYPACMRCS